AALLFGQIAESDIQAHSTIAHCGGVKLPGRYFEAGIEIHRPLDDVSFAAGLGLGYRFLRTAENPLLVGIPRCFALARLAFEQSTHADAAFARLGEVADHLPG